MGNEIFVFGSNYSGRHGRGAALAAKRFHGAKYGVGEGIQKHVTTFLAYAKENPKVIFNVTPIGTGLAGYSHAQIAPMFNGYTRNVKLIKKWVVILG